MTEGVGENGRVEGTVPAPPGLHAGVREVLAAHWRPEGHTVPNGAAYPWRWLWDSCFHSIIWAALGDGERAVTELAAVLADQDADGFVPHVAYPSDPGFLADFWGRSATSSITQPPMYGHAAAELVRRGVPVPDEILDRAAGGLRFLLERRRRSPGGLVTLCHPWESGVDDSPRWDHWCPGGFDTGRWFDLKGTLLGGIERSAGGAPLANRTFESASAGFNALAAFNALELGALVGDQSLVSAAVELSGSLDRRWDPDLATWVDDGAGSATSGRVRTLDALLGALVLPERAPAVLALALDGTAYGGVCGPAGVHRDEPAFRPRAYWRGVAWPQLTYLLWVAACRSGSFDAARDLAGRLMRGADRSGLAEYWDPDDGTGCGAAPQSWTGLAAVVSTA
ncbi:hypothetical protein BH20ACT2_BH20ACT2_10800 [soil metagenome]